MADTSTTSTASSAQTSATGTYLPAEQMAPRDQQKLPWLALALMIGIATPVSLEVAGIVLSLTRLICVISIPILLLKLFMGRFGKVLLIDYLILFYSFWTMLAYITGVGFGVFVFASLQASLTLGGYLVGRATIRSPAQFLAMTRFLVLLIILLLPFALIETQTGVYVIPSIVQSTGIFETVNFVDYGERLGLFRSQVVFTHPIHFGLYCSIPISLYFVGQTNHIPTGTRLLVTFVVLGTVFTSVSSGPFLASLFQIALITYMWITRSLEAQWKLILWVSGIGYAVLEVVTNKPAAFSLASRLAFNGSTAFYRELIWQYGSAQVARTPLLGIAGRTWERPHWMTSSIDNFWLQMAVTAGIPASISMMAVFLTLAIRSGKGHYVRGTDAYYIRVGYTFLMISLMLSLSTVTIWGEVLCMITFVLGAGGYMLQATAPQADATTEALETAATHKNKSSQPVYTRFQRGAQTAERQRTRTTRQPS